MYYKLLNPRLYVGGVAWRLVGHNDARGGGVVDLVWYDVWVLHQMVMKGMKVEVWGRSS